jgi:hypothetical protein
VLSSSASRNARRIKQRRKIAMASLLTLFETEHTILRNVGNYSPSETVLYPIIIESSSYISSYILFEVSTVVRVEKSDLLGLLDPEDGSSPLLRKAGNFLAFVTA